MLAPAMPPPAAACIRESAAYPRRLAGDHRSNNIFQVAAHQLAQPSGVSPQTRLRGGIRARADPL
jgi:hypothetical protein